MKTVYLILCVPISPWAFTNITQKQCLKTSKQYWRQNSTPYSEFYRYPCGGCGKRSHWAQTQQEKEFYISFVALSLLFCSHRRLESTKWWQNHQHFRTFFLRLHLLSSIWEMAREPPYLSGFSKPLSTHFIEKEGYWESTEHTHTHTRTTHPIMVNRPLLQGYWSAK